MKLEIDEALFKQDLFFCAFISSLNINPSEKNREAINKALEDSIKMFNNTKAYNGQYYSEIHYDLIQKYLLSAADATNEIIDVLRLSIMKTMSNSDFISYFTTDLDEYNKVKKQIELGQINSKPLKDVSLKISTFLDDFRYKLRNYNNSVVFNDSLLYVSQFQKDLRKYKDNLVLKKYKDFKLKIDSICSGVKPECYFKIDRDNSNVSINNQIEEYISNTYGIKIKNIYSRLYNTNVEEATYKQLATYITDNKDIQNGFKQFLNDVIKFNGIKHAEKIIDYCISKAYETEEGKFIIDNKLNLLYLDNPEVRALNFGKKYYNDRVFSICLSHITDDEEKGLLFPLYSGFEKEVEEGKEIFKNFIQKVYSNCFDKAYKVFNNPNSIIRESQDNGKTINFEVTMQSAIDFPLGLENDESNICDYFKIKYPNFYEKDSIMGRLYYVVYLIKKHNPEKYVETIYDMLFDYMRMAEKTFDFDCDYTVNRKQREENYNSLKAILKQYNYEINDVFKKYYITALLDRKYATIIETNLFPELEMIGDAIYQFALAEILFYNEKGIKDYNFEDLNSAKMQINVAKHLGTDKLYITNLLTTESCQMDYVDKIRSGIMNNKDGNYIADSLEMIIGSLYKEFVETGEDKLDDLLYFVEKIIVETYDNLEMPKKVYFEDAINSNLDHDYLYKIIPDLYASGDDYYKNYNDLSNSLDKLILTLCLGTNEKEKRQFITARVYALGTLFSSLSNGQLVNAYLMYNINYLIDILEQPIINKYNELKNK